MGLRTQSQSGPGLRKYLELKIEEFTDAEPEIEALTSLTRGKLPTTDLKFDLQSFVQKMLKYKNLLQLVAPIQIVQADS